MRNESRNKIFEPFGILFPDFIESIIRSGNELDHYIFPHYISRNREKTYDRPYDDYVKN